MTDYASLEDLVFDSFSALRPTARMTVTEAAERYHIIRRPGSYNGPWSRAIAPYLVEPQDCFESLEHRAVIFAGPARTGKTAMTLNWTARTAVSDPSDMLLVHMSQPTARSWSKEDLDLFLAHSHEIKALLSPASDADNLYDKTFRSGMHVEIVWPTRNNLSGKTKRRVFLIDYDGMADDIEGQGPAFEMALKRTETYRRFGMCVAESSPGREILNPRYVKLTPHAAPPCKGILGLYQRGDRRRWYWLCPHCGEAFEGDFEHLKWPDSADLVEAAEAAYMVCPNHGCILEAGLKDELNSGGRWVRDGMMLLPNGEIVARPGMQPVRSPIASFWLKGPSAGFQTWKGLVLAYLQAAKTYDETGEEEPLKATTNLDQGLPYVSKSRLSDRQPDLLRERAEDWGSLQDQPTVPEGTRFLIATVDVQSRAFVVQVHGFTESGDIVVIDGFKIRKAARLDGEGDKMPVDPAAFAEDWDLLVSDVMDRTYLLADNSGRRMKIVMSACDSGGRDGVTANAYAFWRRLKANGDGRHRRFALVKGNSSKGAARAYTSFPDARGNGGKMAIASGDVPVVLLGSNLLKDHAAGMLARRTGEDRSGGGMVRYPAWMPAWFFEQLTNEVRNVKEEWDNPSKRRNEAWDLLYYAVGIAGRPFEAKAPFLTIHSNRPTFWDEPPSWATEWDDNEMVVSPQAQAEAARTSTRESASARFRSLGEQLG